MGRLLAVAAVLALASRALAAPVLDPDSDAARRRFDAAIQLYDRGDYAQAIDAFEAARALKPLPAFDYNIARCLERLERWGEAASAYQRYLDEAPNAPEADEVRGRIAVLRARLPKPAPTRSLRTAAIVVGVGALALAAAGTGTYLSVYSDYQDGRTYCTLHPCTAASVADLRGRVAVAEGVGGALWAIGAAALVADVVLWALDGRRRHREHAWLQSPGGGARF